MFMVKKEGIPNEVFDELDIRKIEKQKEVFEITPVVEKHQIKLPIPSVLRKDINISKGKKVKVRYNSKTKELIYKI